MAAHKKFAFVTNLYFLASIVLIIITVFAFTHYTAYTVKMTNTVKKTILFIPGLGLTPSNYATLITNLKKDHYTVITYTSPDTTTTNYQATVNKWTQAISPLIGKQNVIVIGHSVGGAVAAHFCAEDKRCIAGIDLDGGAAYAERIPVPFLYIQGDLGSYCDTQCVQGRTLMELITKNSKTQIIHITGIKHFNFTDLRTEKLKNADYLGPIDGRDIINKDIDNFLAQIKQ